MADSKTMQGAADALLDVARGKHAASTPSATIFDDAARRVKANRRAPYVDGTMDSVAAANAAHGGANGRRLN